MTIDFQSIIHKLQMYWQERGCLIWQPYHTEVGAGTMNPATFLRTLGPEPWNVAYVEPSIRPDDGRYGQNPNRFYQHTQYQVILKPDRGNSQDLFLGSLEAVGIDLKVHDVRFVEDNWAQPAISAWGLGWEVWLDGLEITQFTYFQQVGGFTLDPVSVELTYGLERIAMALQGVRDFKDIRWNDSMTYGDIYLQNEQEASKYAFELADVDRMQTMFDLYEAEATACLDHYQVIPAHDYLLKCNHTFNILDTRGAIGVTERAGYFRRMRALARGVAQAYIDQRKRLEFPWLEDQGTTSVAHSENKQSTVESIARSFPEEPSPLLIEIGTEELPPGDLEDALKCLHQEVPQWLQSLRLEFDQVKILGTPRRLVIYVPDLSPYQPDLEEIVKGPPAKIAFDADGAPTKAAEGFALSKEVATSNLQVRQMDGGEYVVAIIKEKGKPANELIVETFPGLMGSIQFSQSMRWNWTNVSFSRPIRWLLALYGESVLPLEFAGLSAQRITRGLRFTDPVDFQVESPIDYFQKLENQGILLDPEVRKTVVEEKLKQSAITAGGEILPDPNLLLEVTHLVETPSVLMGEFNPRHLELPHEVLIGVMKKHQRYFPVHKNSDLLPYFLVVVNKPAGIPLSAVKQGNEDVVRARFADAAYFLHEDMKVPLEAFVEQLDRLIFQVDLGSMLDKTHRIQRLVADLATMVEMKADEKDVALRAASLCKADLATQMVVEMTSLQGVIGREYAKESGESEDVARAIFEHYLPRTAEDILPKTKPGLVLGLADRLDSLAGLFAAGLAPTGNKDPFAQRRMALGLLVNLIEWGIDFKIHEALEKAALYLPIHATEETLRTCTSYIIERLRNMLLERGFRYDVVDAIISAQGDNPTRASQAVVALSAWLDHSDWEKILPAYSRCVRITRSIENIHSFDVKDELFEQIEERDLYQALITAETSRRSPGSVNDFFQIFIPMIPKINTFFDEVLVMVDDPSIRNNRLGMLYRISSLADKVADLNKLEGF